MARRTGKITNRVPMARPRNWQAYQDLVHERARAEAVESGQAGQSWYAIAQPDAASPTNAVRVDIAAEIGFWGVSADQFIRDLRDIGNQDIDLHINSPGGEVFDGVAIYNALIDHKGTVAVYVDGLAASAASFIAQAGETITMQRGSMMMIHDAIGGCWDNATGMRQTADILDMVSDSIADIYAVRAGGTAATWRTTMKAEQWYGAAAAVKAGLADAVNGDATEGGDDPEQAIADLDASSIGAARALRPEPADVAASWQPWIDWVSEVFPDATGLREKMTKATDPAPAWATWDSNNTQTERQHNA